MAPFVGHSHAAALDGGRAKYYARRRTWELVAAAARLVRAPISVIDGPIEPSSSSANFL